MNEETNVNEEVNEENGNSVNPFGLLFNIVIIVITVHGYLQYTTDFSSGINWTLASASLLLPIINLWWVCCGLIYYWEIHWALALIITLTCLLALIPKAPGYAWAIICIALFMICAWGTFPKRVSELQMADDFRASFDSDAALVSQIGSRADAERFVKKRIAESRTVRARALRLGYKRLAKVAGNAAK